MIYQLLSKIINLKSDALDKSGGVAEGHTEWGGSKKEREEVEIFLATTHIGQLLTAKDSSLMELFRGFREHLRETRLRGPNGNAARVLNSDCEKILHEQYRTLHPCSSDRPSADTLGKFATPSLPKLESPGYQMSSYGEPTDILPPQLVKVLLQRWQLSLGEGVGTEVPPDSAKELTSVPSLNPPSTSLQSKFLDYLEVVIPCWDSVLASDPHRYGPILLAQGVERCVVNTLPLFSDFLLSFERISEGVVTNTNDGVRLRDKNASKERILHLTESLLDVLLRLYLRQPPGRTSLTHKMPANGATRNAKWRATQLSNQELAQGCPSFFLRGKNVAMTVEADASFSSDKAKNENPVASNTMVRELVVLLTHISKASVISSSFSLNVTASTEAICAITCKIFLILSAFSSLCITEPAATDLDEAKHVVNMSVMTLSVLMAQFIGAYSKSFGISPGDSGTVPLMLADFTVVILNQLSCGMLLVTHWLRQSPAIVLQALNTSGCIENLCTIMRLIGMKFINASHSRHVKDREGDSWYRKQNEMSEARLYEFVSFNCSNNADLLEVKNSKRILAQPEFEYYPVAAEDAVDEFLYSYLGLLAAQRTVGPPFWVHQESIPLTTLNQLRLMVLKVFTNPDSKPELNLFEHDVHQMNSRDVDLGSVEDINASDAKTQKMLGASEPPVIVLDSKLVPEEDCAFKKSPKDKLCDNSCLYDLLLQQALILLPKNGYLSDPPSSSHELPSEGQNVSVEQHFNATCSPGVAAQLNDFQQLVDAGLYQILFSDKRFFKVFRDIPRHIYATLYILLHALTFETYEITLVQNGSKQGTQDAGSEILTPSCNVGLDHEVMAALSVFASNQDALSSLKESEQHTVSLDKTHLTIFNQRTVHLCGVCAVLVCALRGPKGNVVRDTLMSHRGFTLMTSVAVGLCLGKSPKTPTKLFNTIGRQFLEESGEDIHSVETSRAYIYSSGALVCRWATRVLLELTHSELVEVAILSKHLGEVFSLLSCKDLLEVGEEIIIRLLCHHPRTMDLDGETNDSDTECTERLKSLVTIIWDVISQSMSLETIFRIEGQQSSHFAESIRGGVSSFGIPTGNFRDTAQDFSINSTCVTEEITVPILRCLRRALYRLRHRLSRLSLKPVRTLQYILCNQNTSGECFLKLIHCVSRPWSDSVMHAEGVRSALQTLISLIACCPALRSHLFSVITPDELVKCFCTEWFTVRPNDWKGFVEAFITFIYEDIDETDQRTEEIYSVSQEEASPLREFSTALSSGHVHVECPEEKHCRGSIQNAVVLIPLLDWLKQLVRTIPSDSPEADLAKIEALSILLKALHNSFLHCRVSRFMCARVGLFEALAQLLLPLMDSVDCTSSNFLGRSLTVSALNSVTTLMKISAIEHIDIKHVKRLLLMIVNSSNARREKLVPLVTNILSEVARTFLCKQVIEPQNYIAFCRNSGTTGVKAMLQDYSTEGYSICLWVRVESDILNSKQDEAQKSQTIFSLQNSDFRTQLSLNVSPTTGCLSITYLDSQKYNVKLDVGFSISLASWVHLAFVHRPYRTLTRGDATRNVTIFKNGEELPTRFSVHYPNMVRGWFLVGADGEAVDRLSCEQGFAGQVAIVHFFTRPLQRKEICQLCSRTFCGYCEGETTATLNTTSGVGAESCIHSLPVQKHSSPVRNPSLSFFQSSELGGIITDALRAPETISGEAWSSIENDLAAQATICIDPRLTGKVKLYNLSGLLRGRSAESALIVFEATLVCCSTSIVDALYILGAVHTVVMPLLMLLVNPQLPFSERTLLRTFSALDENVSSVERRPTPADGVEERSKAIKDMLQLLHVLTHDDVVRVGMTESGLFLFIANVLQKLGPAVEMSIPEQILSFCIEQLLFSDVLFEAAYTAFFLSSNMLHACPYTTQLIWINCQRIAVSMDDEVRSRIRALGAQMFVVSEIKFAILHYTHAPVYPSAHNEGYANDRQNSSFATEVSSPDGKSLRGELLRFFEALTVDPITMADAVPILHLTSILYHNHQQLPEDELAHALRRIRVLLFTCNPLLCQFLGREDYLAVLLPFLRCPTVPAAAQREILLLIILLVSRSKYTQKYMNPSLFITKDAVHTPQDISFAWLKEYLCLHPTDIALYLALRSTLFGDFVVLNSVPLVYTPLSGTGTIEIPAVLELILLLIQRSHDSSLKLCVLKDLVACLKNDPKAWQRLISIQGWHVMITNIYKTEGKCSAVDVNPLDSSQEIDKHNSQGLLSSQISATSGNSTPNDGFHLLCSFILFFTLSQALMNVNYAASEQELIVTYLQDQGLHVLLNHVLCGVADCLRMGLLTSTKANSNMFTLPNTNVMLTNLTTFVYTVENVLFYSASCRSSSGNAAMSQSAPYPSLPLRTISNPRYVEWNELVIVLNEDAVPSVEYSDTTFSSSNSPTLRPPVNLDEEAVRYVGETHFASHEGRHDLLSSPDGRWLHMSLALKVAYLLTTNESILNGGCHHPAVGSVEPAHSHDSRCRRGGFLRIFERLIRVASSMMLHSVDNIEALLQLLDRYTSLMAMVPSGLLSLIKPKTVVKHRNHSPLTITMSILYFVHNLILRRLHVSGLDSTMKYSDANVELINRFKRLFCIFKSYFGKMLVFAFQGGKALNLHASEETRYHGNTLKTYNWLCDCSRRHPVSLIDEFLEMTSHVDYTVFLKRCMLAMERNRNEAKAVASGIHMEHQHAISRFREMVSRIEVTQRVVLESIEGLFKAGVSKASDSCLTSIGNPSATEALQAAASASLTVVMVRFMEHIKNTIWSPELESQSGATRYVRLSLVEQQPLMRCKVVFDKGGTSHRVVSELSCNKSQSPSSGLPVDGDEERLARTRLCLRDAKESVWEQGLTEDDKGKLGADGEMNFEIGQDGFWPNKIYSSTYYSQMSSAATTFGNGALEDELSNAADLSLPRIVLSLPCEVLYMMHCWSAMFVIRGMTINVIIDDENVSYNPNISSGAQPFLMRPQSFGFSIPMIAQIAPGRRFRMKRTAMEIWLHNRRSFFLNFSDTATMRLALREIVQKIVAGRRLRDPRRVLSNRSFYVFQENPLKEPLLAWSQDRWRSREMSNFDYLMWLNFLAGRSVNDMAQYPVFPWILADYTSETLDLRNPGTFRDLSKPIGACGGDKRCERIKRLYEETKTMGDIPSHYFTHYSSPAVVLYYLMRLEPFTTLHILLQGGQFDQPDRMFHMMSATFNGVMDNMQDTRELIPELFYLPELCVNSNDVLFGRKQNKEMVDNLLLPPWAHGSPHDFIYHMREALECDYVSSMLHHWIDLIFGVQQRGKEAIKALNVFRWHSYEDLGSSYSSVVDQHQLLDILDNIGQTPIQLFQRSHHPPRQSRELLDPLVSQVGLKMVSLHLESPKRIALVSFSISGNAIVINRRGEAITVKLVISPLKHSAPLENPQRLAPGSHHTLSSVASSVATKDFPNMALGVGKDKVDPCLSSTSDSMSRSEADDRLEVSAHNSSFLSSQRGNEEERFSFDISEGSEFRTTAAPLSLIPEEMGMGDGPCTSGNVVLLSFDSESFIALGGLFDHSVTIRHLSQEIEDIYLRAHRGRVIRLAVSGDSHYLVSGSEDTTFVVWTCHLPRGQRKLEVQPLFTIYRHEDLPTAVHLSSTLDVVATASMDGVLMLHSLSTASLERTLRHPRQHPIHCILVQSSCYVPNILFYSRIDHIVHQISLNGTVLRSFSTPGRLMCWTTTSEQYLLMHCVPFNNMAATVAHRTNLSGEGSAINTTAILYVHSFFMKTLRTVSLPSLTTASTIACHPKNPQVVMLGDIKGTVILVRTCAPKSAVLV